MSETDAKQKVKFSDLHAGERFSYSVVEVQFFGHAPVFVKTSTHQARGEHDSSLVIVLESADVDVFAIDRR